MIARMNTPDTKSRILAVARYMVQAHGYNALSIREVANEVGIKGPAVHHHYPTKGDLGAALARQYSDDAVVFLEGLLEQHHGCRASRSSRGGQSRGAEIHGYQRRMADSPAFARC